MPSGANFDAECSTSQLDMLFVVTAGKRRKGKKSNVKENLSGELPASTGFRADGRNNSPDIAWGKKCG